MSSKKPDEEKLPDGWVLCTSKSNPGRKYYFNKKTGKSLWTQPQPTDHKDKKVGKRDHQKLEINRSDEVVRRGNKRKSDGIEGSSANKKQRPEQLDRKKYYSVQKKETHRRENDQSTHTPKTPLKSTHNKHQPSTSYQNKKGKKRLAKNIASTRLENLNAKLHKEVLEEESAHSLKRRSSNDPSKATDKSPNDKANQSPTHDNIHSIPSTSQFFTANKIISSMKAQLPEKFCNNDKQKDTFADIEKGICNQTPEYPFSKHPATPPQFSEASKLVSAIKLKLGYKINTPKDSNSVSKEIETSTSLNSRALESSNSEAMEVEDFREPKEIQINPQRDKNDKDIVLVVDTNIFIHHLDIIKNVLNSHLRGYSEQPNLLVPWRVINELDRLKDNNNGNSSLSKRARAAMDYLYKSLPVNTRIKGQSLRDANCHIYPCEMPDDEILNCALQQVERNKNVLLISNDKNLCNKADINSVEYIEIDSLKDMLENKPQPASDELYASFVHASEIVYPLLANILESEMRAKYDNLWQYVIIKAPPWTLDDVLQCLLKHWIAVFNEVFPRIEPLITDLKNTLSTLQNKNAKTITQSEVSTFKELCLDIAKRCQIIPEYMELAKTCVEQLSRDCASETEDNTDSVVDTFECLWTVCSSYCAKLATSADIAHNLEDKMPENECLQSLSDKWNIFSTNINAIARDIQRVLSAEESINMKEDALSELEKSLSESLNTLSLDKTVSRNQLRIFCNKYRNMLQEASSKFSQLSELLIVCKEKLSH
ncbi:transcriptional protein SWT1 [Pieris napi]|uniref:transcriptional protein SWT1 n=1 Tax=Pieris napi TaxID=78633 RepID=UPI001FB9DD72|nr:transcriptional protein SWT1 [Pieris napi]